MSNTKVEKKTKSNEVDDDDYDSDADSDYNPDKDPDAVHDEDEIDNKDDGMKQLSTMTFSRKRKVDDMWAQMQEDDAVSSKPKVVIGGGSSGDGQKKAKKSKQQAKALDILSSIFGKGQSKKILKGVSNDDACTGSVDIKELARASVKKLAKKEKITETRKFAGQEITIERSVLTSSSSSSNSSSSAAAGKKVGGAPASSLDSVLDTLKGPKTVSTVAKSNYDWETFKEKEGLEDDLATAAKDGYLTRKEFLQRCDYRAYEKERDDRLTKPTNAPSAPSLM